MRRLTMQRRPLLIIVFGVLLMAVLVFGWRQIAEAQTATTFSIESIGSRVGLGDSDLVKVVFNIIRWVLGFLTFAALAFVMYGGFLWLTANGDEKKVEKAKRVILQALIGMVIVLLAWAIVFFVARFFSGATSNGNTNNGNVNGPCLPGTPGCLTLDPTNTFNIAAIATCSAGDTPAANVPRASKVAVFFNSSLAAETAEKAVEESKNLITYRCTTTAAGGAVVNDPTCASQNLDTRPVNKQAFSLNRSLATKENPTAEWIAKSNSNSLTFDHKSFTTTGDTIENQLFEENRTYRIQLPRTGADNQLRDQTRFSRPLEHCQAEDGGPIPGDSEIAPNCTEDETRKIIHWTFTTGTDIEGPPIAVSKSVPTSAYKTDLVNRAPDQDVDRDGVICLYFSNPMDPTSVDPSSFTVTKYQSNAPPTAGGSWNDGTLSATPLPNSNFSAPYFVDGGKGVCIAPQANYDAFSWYRVKAQGIRNLCGTTMEPDPYEWVFESNDRVPGIEKLYPPDGFENACPATKVKVVFRTSMWRGTSSDCSVGLGSYVTSGSLRTGATDSGRSFKVSDPWISTEPNKNCRVYEFTDPPVDLVPDATYSATVLTDKQISTDGTKLEVGTPGSNRPWSFSIKPAGSCVQPPLITRISPRAGKEGQCVSVLGDYFEKRTETVSNGKPETGDALTLGDRNQLTDPDVAWNDQSIVTVVDAGATGTAAALTRGTVAAPRKYTYKVTVQYPDPIGPLSDELTDSFSLLEGDGSAGPCLLALTKTGGPPGTTFDAIGKRFGAGGGQSRVRYDLVPAPGELPYVNWSATRVQGLKTPTDTSIGRSGVSVVDEDGDQSNEIDFETTPIPPVVAGAPRVDESEQCVLNAADPADNKVPSPAPKSGETNICLTAQPSARFTKTMKASTLTAAGAIVLDDCTNEPCTAVGETTVNVTGDLYGFTLATPRLQPSHTYRLTISGDVESAGGVKMGPPYQWRFSTKADDSDCPIAAIRIRERSATFRIAPFTYPMTTALYSAACTEITGSCGAYTWDSSKKTVADVEPKNAPTAVASSADPITEGTTKVTVQCQSRQHSINLTYDQTSCSTNADCQGTNRFSESCGESRCENSHCVPVVTNLVPDNGAPGTWATVHGCWFGSYSAGQSKVIVGADQGAAAKEAPAFSPAICDNKSSWQNDYIVREIPAGSVTGKIKIVRDDAAEALSSNQFTINATIRPGLCNVVPGRGGVGSQVTLAGTRFGDSQAANRPTGETNLTARDAALIVRTDDATGTTRRAMTNYPSWTETSIGTLIPTTSETGISRVTVRNDAVDSNDVLFTVQSAQAQNCQACTVDTLCPDTASGIAQGCSLTTGCCAPRAVIVATTPSQGASAICRNIAPEITFSQPIDEKSVTESTVRYFDGGTAIVPRTDVRDTTISIQPGLLTAGSPQEISLSNVTPSPITINNPGFEVADASGVPSQWPNPSRASQSTDIRPGAAGKSGLADCAGCGAGQQAWLTQDITGAGGALLPANSYYRLTGWVKVAQPANVQSGLITQCLDGADRLSTCDFDLETRTPGMFTGNSGGWKKIVAYLRNDVPAKLRIKCLAGAGAKAWCDDIALERLTTAATSIRGTNGVVADITGTPLNFTTGADICALNRVSIDPSYDHWETDTDTTQFVARALATNGEALAPVPGYRWDWKWLSSKESVATVVSGASVIPSRSLATAAYGGSPGDARIKATASVTENALQPTIKPSRSAYAKISSDICSNPWLFSDSAANCDVAGGGCVDYDFDLYYCRGANAANLLPEFSYMGQGTTTNPISDKGAVEGKNNGLGRLKTMFFKTSADAVDAIGILIYPNPGFLSPSDWFAERSTARAGSGAATFVGGFPALQDGATTYVGVTHATASGTEGLMFVFSYNANQADSKTRTVYANILEQLVFNTHLGDDITRAQLQRDTQRRLSLSAIARAAAKYRTGHNGYPNLSAGTYLSTLSTSRWPSWQSTLGAALGTTMPTDPDNTFARTCTGDRSIRCTNDDQCLGVGACDQATVCAAPAEGGTCWAESTKAFQCPTGSSVFLYKGTTTSFDLYAKMEYDGDGSFINYSPATNACFGVNGADCRCFNYNLNSTSVTP